MHPCNYSFSCREVAVGDDDKNFLFSGGNGERRFSFKIDRNAQIYLVSNTWSFLVNYSQPI